MIEREIRLSIIVLVYRSEIYVLDTIESLLKQTNKNFELVIVNNGSTDNSMKIIRNRIENEKEVEINIIDLESNIGCGQGRRVGYEKAKGMYISYVDSDDLVEPDYVENIINKSYEDPDIILFGRTNSYPDGKKIEVQPDNNLLKSKCYLDAFSKYCFKKSLVQDNAVDFSTGIMGEDREFSLFLSEYVNSISIIPKSIYIFRLNQISTSQNVNYTQILEGKHRVFDASQIVYNRIQDKKEKHIRYVRAYSYFLGSLRKEESFNYKLFQLFERDFLDKMNEPLIPYKAFIDGENIRWIKQIMKHKVLVRWLKWKKY